MKAGVSEGPQDAAPNQTISSEAGSTPGYELMSETTNTTLMSSVIYHK